MNTLTTAHHATRAMGCQVHFAITASDPQAFFAPLTEHLADLEHAWSRFAPDAELARLNTRPGSYTVVSPTLFDALAYAQAAADLTRYAFNPLVGRSLVDLGYDRTWLELDPTVPPSTTPTPPPPASALVLSPKTHLVYLPVDAALDLGGVGKGLAADALLSHAGDLGAHAASINVGGDLAYAAFDKDVPPYPLAIAGMSATLAHLSFTSHGAVATSSPQVRAFADGRHHIINPATGHSATTDLVTASVIAPTAALAEVISTALIVLPLPDALTLVERLELACVCEHVSGEIITRSSPNHEVYT